MPNASKDSANGKGIAVTAVEAPSTLEIMLNDLEAHKLEVQLAPSKRHDRREWDMIRVVCNAPPKWYRRLCANHVSSREIRRGKFDTRIKRANILATLRRLVEYGSGTGMKYEEELLAIARRKAA